MRYVLLATLLFACGGSKPQTSDNTPPVGSQGSAASGSDCVKSGCSGTVCTEPGKEMVTTCEMKPEYACYQNASCERQGDGTCGWTQTADLTKCLANPPPLDGGPPPQ